MADYRDLAIALGGGYGQDTGPITPDTLITLKNGKKATAGDLLGMLKGFGQAVGSNLESLGRGGLSTFLGAPVDTANTVRTPYPMEVFGDVNYTPDKQLPGGSRDILGMMPRGTATRPETAGMEELGGYMTPATAKVASKAITATEGLPVGMSIRSVKAPQQSALDLAQQRAALPVEQGGLGLPANNTPEMRAAAMGFDTPAYHGTTVWETNDGRKLGDIQSFNRLASTEIVGRKPSLDQVGIWASDRPDELGAGMYSGNQGAIYPLMLRMENPKSTSYEQMARTASNVAGGEILGAGVVPKVSNVEPYRGLLKEQGYDSLQLSAKQGSPYTEFQDQTGYVLLDPAQIRSRFAAFDPFRKDVATAIAMGVALPDLLAKEKENKQKKSVK